MSTRRTPTAKRRQATPTKKDASPQQVQQRKTPPDSPSPLGKLSADAVNMAHVVLDAPMGYNAAREIAPTTVNACVVAMEKSSMPPSAQALELAEYLDKHLSSAVVRLHGLPSFFGKHYTFGDCGNDLAFSSHAIRRFLKRCGKAECEVAFVACVERIINEHQRLKNNHQRTDDEKQRGAPEACAIMLPETQPVLTAARVRRKGASRAFLHPRASSGGAQHHARVSNLDSRAFGCGHIAPPQLYAECG